MKRILSLLLVVMLFASLTLTVSAAKVDDTVTITFTASNPGITGYEANLNYDSSALQLVSVNVLAGTGASYGNTVGAMSATVFTDSNLFTATFKVLSGAQPGATYPVTVSAVGYDANVEEIALSISGGSVTIDECDHSYTTTTEATCGAAGTKTCSKCGATESIPATGNHNYEVVTAATCGADGLKKCSGCGATQVIPATGEHDYQPKTPATCVAEGENECTGCGDIQKTDIDPDNHKDNDGDKVCDDCGEDLKCVHQWDKGVVTKEPTCEEKGEKTYTCKLCQETKTEEIKAKGHKWEWIVDKKATGSSTGLKHEECSECGMTRNEGTVIPKIQGLDNVPQTGDITNQITMAVASVVIMMVAAVAFVFKRKAAK